MDIVARLFTDIGSFGLPQAVQPVIWVMTLVWGAFILDRMGLLKMPGLVPGGDLAGVVTASLAHGNFQHIWSNTVALGCFLYLYFLVTEAPWMGFVVMFIVPGITYWLLGSAPVIGVSDTVFAFGGWVAVYLILSGIMIDFPLIIPLFIAHVFSMLKGALPFTESSRVSIFSHFLGLVVGITWTVFDFNRRAAIDPRVVEIYQQVASYAQ